MAFALYVSNGTDTTYLSDRDPFAFESLEGISNAPTVRYEQRGPLQHGATDLGYRLGPRVLQLSLVFTATTDAQLDTYREQLMDAFKPSDVALRLYYERDDSTTRTLDVHAVGDLAIELTPELRPTHTHRAKVQLRAANPLWVDQTVVQSTLAGASLAAANNGDVAAYPVIRLAGPMGTITVTNSSTGDSFSLGTIVIGSGDIYTIDLRNGRKRVYDLNGFNRLGYVTNPAELAGFRLEPNPITAGGTNTITVAGTSATSVVTVEHYNQYVSF